MDCSVMMAGGDVWMRGQIGGALSHESEHDLALMVSDFLENGSAGADSRCSSDSDSSRLSDLAHLADKIKVARQREGPWRLKLFLPVMVEAARSSLNQNSMPLPPWRSLAYLQAKWQSPYQRQINLDEQNAKGVFSFNHKKCSGHLKMLQSLLQSEIEADRLLKPKNDDKNRRYKPMWSYSLFQNR